ncbi:Uncharacterized protein APZ42_026222 [Daphnia magna]|uniref:Uncharacterized protein n=1 Tax=Daphnia magna TaxID=35525 RepID=A0A164SEE6_9CRUS|nr:Uncharacterized protein APZ42_026222 [Daphnia magna]
MDMGRLGGGWPVSQPPVRVRHLPTPPPSSRTVKSSFCVYHPLTSHCLPFFLPSRSLVVPRYV